MTHALAFLAFFGLMTAQALGALFSCGYPWHHAKSEHRGELAIPVVLADEPQQATVA